MKPEKKRTNLSLNSFAKPLGKIFRKFHLTLFFALVVGGLSIAVIQLSETLGEKEDVSNYSSSISSGSIDKATLNKIQALHSSSEPGEPLALPQTRINPFGE